MAETASFLGTGWSFPPSFSRGGGDVDMISGTEDIHQSLQILLSTQPGERLMQDDYGCDMNGFVFEEIDQGLRNTMRRIISDAILYHEPRITLEGLAVSESEAEQGVLLISIDYTVRTTNTRYNMVFPFYIDEASAPGP
ncbi:MAG: GPW/gp25 family protein [Chromatiales bacterium]|nr:GPW/gp25 family protein [Chromatiales bacterium]MDH4030409.1 GPW/gp25 family protein [Chromatiales bacterium]